jgi:AsmA protein
MKIAKLAAWVLGAIVLLLIAVGVAFALLFDANAFKSRIEQAAKERTGRTLTLEGKVGLSFFPSIGAALGRAKLSERGSEREFVSLDSARVSVQLLPLLRGSTIVDEISIEGLKANLVKGKDGKFNFDDLLDGGDKPSGAPKSGGDSMAFDVSGVEIKRSSLTYRDENSGQEINLHDLDLTTGRIAPGVPGKVSLSAAATGKNPALDGKLKLAADYRLAEGGAFSVSDLDGGINLKSGSSAVDVTLKVPSIEGSAKMIVIRSIAGEVAIASPDMPQKSLKLPISGSATYARDKGVLAADLATKFDDSNIKAKVGHAPLSFDLAIDKLDLDRYMPPAKADAKDKADTPVNLSALKDLNLNGSVQIGALTVQRLKLSEVKAQIRAANGRLEVAPHSAKLYGGTASGALSASADNRIALKETLSGIAIGPLLKDVAQRDALEGRGNVTLDVSTAGASVNALKKALAGSARVQLRDGSIKGINLAETLRKTKAMLGSKSASQQAAEGSQKTDFSALDASFTIRGGVAHNQDLDVKAPLFRIGGVGDVDIGNSSLNYLAKASIVASAKGQGGAGLDELAGLTVPVKLNGPFDAVKYEIDYGALASGVVKSKVVEKLTERLGGKDGGSGSSGDKLREGLRGLFGK